MKPTLDINNKPNTPQDSEATDFEATNLNRDEATDSRNDEATDPEATDLADNEATDLGDPEATDLADNEATDLGEDKDVPLPTTKRRSHVREAVVSGGMGVLIGSVSGSLLGMTVVEEGELPDHQQGETSTTTNEEHPTWLADDTVPVATSVTDDMSFGEAFSAARAEVGPGGAFEWHGNVYGTYTAEEWNAMTPEEHQAYNEHFNWAGVETSADTADDTHDIVVDVDPAVDTTQDGDVEILGVIHDSDSGANFGVTAIDGQEVIFVDVDGDMTFDYMASDVNHNGQLDPGEMVDIHNEGLTVDALGGITHPDVVDPTAPTLDDPMADAGNTIDFSNDPHYEG
jgi:hypothetical protein